MYLLLLFIAVGGGTALAFSGLENIMGLVVLLAIAAMVGFYLSTGVLHVDGLLVASWKVLSGVGQPGDVVADCPVVRSDFLRLVGLLLSAFLAVLNFMLVLLMFALIPAALIACMIGVFWYLTGEEEEEGAFAVACLMILGSVGLAVITGLNMRLMHFFSGWGC